MVYYFRDGVEAFLQSERVRVVLRADVVCGLLRRF